MCVLALSVCGVCVYWCLYVCVHSLWLLCVICNLHHNLSLLVSRAGMSTRVHARPSLSQKTKAPGQKRHAMRKASFKGGPALTFSVLSRMARRARFNRVSPSAVNAMRSVLEDAANMILNDVATILDGQKKPGKTMSYKAFTLATRGRYIGTPSTMPCDTVRRYTRKHALTVASKAADAQPEDKKSRKSAKAR